MAFQLLQFEAVEYAKLPWIATEGSNDNLANMTVEKMINEIIVCCNQWKDLKKQMPANLVEEVKNTFFVEYINRVNQEEGNGSSTFDEDTQEIKNTANAYRYLIGKVTEEEKPEDYGLLEVSLLQEMHKIILPLRANNSTKPGQFSQNRRYAPFKGETHEYPCPENMEETVQTLIDRLKQG
ncbi:uncharacterized protein LOC124436705 isoform X3 [Xenia sp. Carnegie-2017]|uniref:uncharacterized protein LOC124436705 isoform X3 n=1 Tax=Xenia sp. Carnegie-2017 TaxID=2897299 RepID=UPI001F04883D|nr:uncharacterized protein LOC124436705 isoform X3 [Xenia sp. Carnegie-2017]